MKDIIKTILYRWKERELPRIVEREAELESYARIKPNKIIVISGFRRTGKTFLVFALIKKLLEKSSKEKNVHINFEDERIPVKTEFLTELLPVIKETFGEPEYLFLDEIQMMPDWSRWLRRIYDDEGIRIFVTGSSSKMSEKEIPTELRGRFIEVRLFPLSFREFLRFKNITIELPVHSENEKAKILRALNEYLEYGGMPEVVLAGEDKKFELINGYYNTLIRRDIIEKFKIRNEESLKAVLRLLLNSTAYSISKLYNTLKSLNYAVGKTTIQKYLSYIEMSYFMHSLPIFSFKAKDQMQYPRKIYFVDTGFIRALSTKTSENMGKLYENAVFMEFNRKLRHPEQEIYYWRSPQKEEVDFVIRKGFTCAQLVQVCYDIDDYDTKKREIRALLKASKELKCKNLLVISEDKEGTEKHKGKTVKFIPLWKFLLGEATGNE